MNKVRVGFVSFTEITDPAEHRSYNEWHMLDHMPEQYPIEGVAYGQRWVRTPALRDQSTVADGSPLAAIHYLTLYLMTEPVDRTLHEFRALGGDLRAMGRFHQQRTSHLSGPLRVVGNDAARRVLVSAEAIPYRPHRGVHVIVERVERHDDEYLQWWHTHHAPALCALDGVAGVWQLATSPQLREAGWSTGNRRIAIVWLDGDVATTSANVHRVDRTRRERTERDGISVTELAGGFETITPWEWDWFEESRP
jgi:hypothetical protein